MIHSIIATGLKMRWMVAALAIIVLIAGADLVSDIPVDVWPAIEPPLVEIQTEALGLSAAEVESFITVPMEADLLNGVAWLDTLTSESVAGLSSIRLVFEAGTDPIRARQMVAERLTQSFALPNVSQPPMMLPPVSSASRVMIVGLTSRELSLIDLSVLARWNIKPRLMGVPGVANVSIWGQRDRQLQVQVDPRRLAAAGVTLDQVVATAGNALWVSPLSFLNASTPGTAGWIDTPNQRLGLHHILPIRGPADLASVPVVGARNLRLAKVATVVEDHQPLIGDAALGDTPGLLLVIEKFPGADTLDVTEEVEEAIAEMRPGYPGVAFDTTVFRPATYLTRAIRNLAAASLLGLGLVVLLVAAFLDDVRPALVSAAAVVVSLAAAGLVLYWRGASANVLVVAGIAIAAGAVIDDAVVGVESVWRRGLPRPEAGGGSLGAALAPAALGARRALAVATLIALLVAVPLFFVSGPTGAFLRPLASAYAVVLLAALVVALLVTPSLSGLLGGAAGGRRGSPLVQWLVTRYAGLLTRALAARRWVAGVAAVALAAGLAVVPALDWSGWPTLQETDLVLAWEGVGGMSRTEMNRLAAQVSREVTSLPGVRNAGLLVGRAVTGDRVVGINTGELWVSLDGAADSGAMLERVRAVVDGFPGLKWKVGPYRPDSADQVFARADRTLSVRLYGADFDVLRRLGEDARSRLAAIDGVGETRLLLAAQEPQVEIEVDLAAAQPYQVKPGEVRRQATTLLSGLSVGNLFEEQKVFDVVVWGVPEIRRSLHSVRELLIETPRGQVPLGKIAQVRLAPSPVVIPRAAVSRYTDVVASVAPGKLDHVRGEAKNALGGMTFPLEYHAQVLGGAAAARDAWQRVLAVGALVVAGIFLILQAFLGSGRAAALFLISLPAALSGGLLTVFFVEEGTASLGTLGGLLVVLVMTIRGGLVLLRRWQQREEESAERGLPLIVQGAQERLVPVLLTALAIGLAFLAPVLGEQLPGYEILHPMGVAILGGLPTATLLLLFGLPVLYLRLRSRP